MIATYEVKKIVNIAIISFLIIGFTIGLISGIIIGEYLEMKFLTKQTYEASQNNHILKNDYGYFKVEKINFSEKINYSNIFIINSTMDNK